MAYKLTEADAKARKAVVSGVEYDLELALMADHFEGAVTVRFTSTRPETFLDFSGKRLNLVRYRPPARMQWLKPKVHLAGLSANNELSFEFSCEYSNNGTGLFKYIDPEDNKTYLYTYLCPFFAHSVFPCFDQPDLKAILKLSVTAPSSFAVISNQHEVAKEEIYLDRTVTVFEKTQLISTYAIALVAGDYVLKYDTEVGEVPLRLWCRASYLKYLPYSQMFEWTRAGIAYYSNEFSVAFPFSKYDQVFVPELNMGAMENSGCVILSDSRMWKAPPTPSEEHFIRNMMLHELAHMWFGNLVTMAWWDDLWLNESFATYMSYRAEQAIGYDSWLEFLSYKTAAYQMDRMSSTHAVRVKVNDTQEAQSNLDSITYGKGSALVKQLVFWIGQAAFFRGVRDYFKKHAWTNVTIDDFVAALQAHAGEVNLKIWVDEWLLTPGLNSLNFYQNEDTLTVVQSFLTGTRLRCNRFDLACYDSNAEVIEIRRLTIPETSISSHNLALPVTPAAIIPNPEDHCYFDIVLDKKTLAAIGDSGFYSKLPELTRGTVLNSLGGMLETFELSAVDLIKAGLNIITAEDNENLLDIILNSCSRALAFLPYDLRSDFSHQMVVNIESRMHSNPDWPPTHLIYLHRKLISFIFSPTDIYNYSDWFMNLRRAEKWQGLMLVASTLTLDDVRAMLAEELRYDVNDAAVMFRRYCEASAVDSKSTVWFELTRNWRQYSKTDLEMMMKGFNRENQKAILQPFTELYFRLINEVLRQSDREYAESFFVYLIPRWEEPAVLLEKLESVSTVEPWITKLLKETRSQLEAKAKGQALVLRQLSG